MIGLTNWLIFRDQPLAFEVEYGRTVVTSEAEACACPQQQRNREQDKHFVVQTATALKH